MIKFILLKYCDRCHHAMRSAIIKFMDDRILKKFDYFKMVEQ